MGCIFSWGNRTENRPAEALGFCGEINIDELNMRNKYKIISITKVGKSGDPKSIEVQRGVFNTHSLFDYLSQSLDEFAQEITIDLSRVGWINLSDWWAFTCILLGQIEKMPNLKIRLEFVAAPKFLIPYRDCADYFAGRTIAPEFSDDEYKDSYVVHRVLNFVKSIEGTASFENVSQGRIILTRLTRSETARSGWYRRNHDIERSVILPRTNIRAEEMCLKFANRNQVKQWQEAMANKRLPNAAIFQSSEFWRVLCHELARNVIEHAEGPGFLAGRVVLPKNDQWPIWCPDVYGQNTLDNLKFAKKHGFVELCISDSGLGIPNTIKMAYSNRYKERHRKYPSANEMSNQDLLKFVFDELGTSKETDYSWITDRHAMGHILLLIKKYDGILSICSGDAKITYCAVSAGSGKFKRCPNQLGYEPQETKILKNTIPGTHLQMLIPLTPERVKAITSGHAPSYLPNPSSFHIDYQHPVGPLVPLRDKLGALSMGVKGSDIKKFKEGIRGLARGLLRGGHPRNQLLVFDFGEVDWVPAQFETFLYLMQNVFLNRLVLFTQVPHDLAELINSYEDEDIPTYLPEAMQEDIQNRELEREFSEGKFLETYSALGALVLGLGPDRGEYLFGVRSNKLRNALLELIHGERQTIQGLCNAHGLDQYILSSILHNASDLFEVDDQNRWCSVFDINDLEIQRLRAITEHFDNVAQKCKAWRGILDNKSNSNQKTSKERFYLPSEYTVYTEFFESSRILARERYVLEVAERLIYRLCCGLENLNIKGKSLTLNDIDILACSTSPTVMLAEAIRRAWPSERYGKRPVVIDYGPSLFAGADAAKILNSNDSYFRAVVVQDLVDEGTLSKKLVKLIEDQSIEVLFAVSFIRFLGSSSSIKNKSHTFSPKDDWGTIHQVIYKPLHSMIGLPRPKKISRPKVQDWGVSNDCFDYVVDPRSLRPVPLTSLRLESGYSEERSLIKRDSHLKEFDMDQGTCRFFAGHFVYGQRHFNVVVDVRGILMGAIGAKIIVWLADLCCDYRERNAPWERKQNESLHGEVSVLLLPMRSQIHYILPELQIELAQRGKRVPHFFLDATSFGGGVETYYIPYQLQDQIYRATSAIKTIMEGQGTEKEKQEKVKEKKLRILLIDDAIFSGRTVQTILKSLSKHVLNITNSIYGKEVEYPEPIDWIRVFVILNQLPAAKSSIFHQLSLSSASTAFQFDEYAPFIGVPTFSAKDCPGCRKLERLEQLEHRVKEVGPIHIVHWIVERRKALAAINVEAPSFKPSNIKLPVSINLLSMPGGEASEYYMPKHADSAIWRFHELMYLSYPIRDVLESLKTTRKSGLDNPDFREEYSRFRLAVYDWCVENWHQVSLYHAESTIFDELKLEIQEGESIFIEVLYQLNTIIQHESTSNFVKWAIDQLAVGDSDRKKEATKTTLDLDTGLTLFFYALHGKNYNKSGLLEYLHHKQSSMIRKSSFLSILYLRLTQPRRKADPAWALNTIAEICFRGRTGKTAEDRRTSDHELLGYIVFDTARKPDDEESRRRLEGSICNFIAAVDNIQPYFDEDLLSDVVTAIHGVREWLRKPILQATQYTEPLVSLIQRMQDSFSWKKFSQCCHMPTNEFKAYLEKRLYELRNRNTTKEDETDVSHLKTVGSYKDIENNLYYDLQLNVNFDPEVAEWCLMTHIPRLRGFLSNVALEPAKKITSSGPSEIFFKKADKPQSILIEVLTRFGSAQESKNVVESSSKIGRSFDDMQLFGVEVSGPTIDTKCPDDGLRFSLVVPVGFK